MNLPRLKATPRSAFAVLSLLTLAHAAAFIAGRYVTRPAEASADPPQAPAPAPSGATAEEHVKSIHAADLAEALTLLQSVVQGSDRFRIHDVATFLALELDTATLLELLRRHREYPGPETDVVHVIFTSELFRRNPSQLAATLMDPAFDPESGFTLELLFRYLGKTHPESSFDFLLSLTPKLRETAIRGLYSSGNPRSRDLANALQAQLRAQRQEEEITAQRETVRDMVANKVWLSNRHALIQKFSEAYRSDPASGIALAMQIDSPNVRMEVLSQLFAAPWESPTQALDALDTLYADGFVKSARQRNELLSRVVNHAAPDQIPETLSLLSQSLSSSEQLSLLNHLHSLAHRAPLEFLDSAIHRNAPASLAKLNRTKAALSSLAQSDLDAAMNLAQREIARGQPTSLLTALIQQAHLQSGEEAALALYRKMDTASDRSMAMAQLANVWGTEDPLGFLEWAVSQPEPVDLSQAARRVSSQWVNANLPEAQTFASALPPGEIKDAFDQQIVHALANHSPDEAFAYALNLEPGNLRHSLLSQTASQWVSVEPEVAVPLLTDILEDESFDEADFQSSVILKNAALTWSYSDAAAATKYFMNVRSSRDTSNAVQASVSQWLNQDPRSATAFLTDAIQQGLSEDRLRTLAFSHELARNHESIARLAASNVSDPEIRRAMFDFIEKQPDPAPQPYIVGP